MPQQPEGVNAIEGSDTIDAEIEDVGAMTVDVTERDAAFEDVDVQKSQKDEYRPRARFSFLLPFSIPQ